MKNRSFNKEDFVLIKRALQYIKPYKFRFISAFICILSGIAFGLIQPLLWARLLTSLFGMDYNRTLLSIFHISIFYVLQAVVGFLQSYLFSFLSENIIYDLKRDMYRKVLNLPVRAFDEMRVGDFISRLHGDASSIANVITNQLLNTVVDILKVIVIGGAVFSISVPLAVIVITAFPFSYFIFSRYGRKLREKNKEIAKVNDSYFSDIQESISGIREIKSLGIKESKFQSFLSLAADLKHRGINLSILNTLSQTLSQGVNFATEIAVLAAGGYLILKGDLSMEYFIAFASYSNQFSASLMNVTRLNSSIQQVLISLERIFGLMDNLSYSKETFGERRIKQIEGNIKFENVGFEYTENTPVLKGISFKVPQNKKIAIVGSSGSGKTTIFNLLLRFYNPVSGRITIDDNDIREFDEESIRSHISVVRQDSFLFNISISDNLLLAKPSATEKEIKEACMKASIHEFIMNLPQGYNSIIGENGVNLSGGQKQRLAIARTLLKGSKIILFDEATSALDNESQYYIKKAVNEMAKKHTVVIIAHRLSTVIEADEIIVLDKGEIVGQGAHSLLIHTNSIYKRLYETELSIIRESEERVV
ncbi:MAG: ABC transporter ATP-binding protein/permease [Clostridia bacterium]|nr:ABC transporter ATP-binding protein/permease [Clostridia bacterium]